MDRTVFDIVSLSLLFIYMIWCMYVDQTWQMKWSDHKDLLSKHYDQNPVDRWQVGYQANTDNLHLYGRQYSIKSKQTSRFTQLGTKFLKLLFTGLKYTRG